MSWWSKFIWQPDQDPRLRKVEEEVARISDRVETLEQAIESYVEGKGQ